MRILVVDDDESIADLLKTALTEQRYTVDVAADGQAGWHMAESLPYDLMLLDVMLPKLDGISFCRRLRSQGSQVPVLLLTAKDTSFDKVAGLDAGADDYIVKPLNLQELGARIRALLRRGHGIASPVLEWGELRLNPQSCEVTFGPQALHLTPKEYALLELFLRNTQRVFSRSAILDQLWTLDDEPPGEDTVKTHIKGLRQKLKAAGAADLIETVYGLGYRLNQSYLKARTSPASSFKPQPDQASAAIAKIWERARGKILQRMQGLEQAAADFTQPDNWHQARQEAHKLAGALGTFGLHRGTELARQIEELLEQQPLNPQQQADVQALIHTLKQTVEQTDQATATSSALADVPLDAPDGSTHQPQVLAVGNDPASLAHLAREAPTWGLRLAIAPDLQTAHTQLDQCQPELVLFDLSLTQLAEESLTLLTDLANRTPPIPVLALTESDQASDRLTASRWQGWHFLQKPAPPSQVLGAMTRILKQSQTTTFTILAVDDDPLILTTLQAVLEPWGMKVVTLDNPDHFWTRLPEVMPDLVMLDVEMPGVSGIQLCQTLRDDTRWNWLPVLFLTARRDAGTIAQIFTTGADDYINKPILAPELVARILNRLERLRSLRSYFEVKRHPFEDPGSWTGDRQQFTQEANRFLKLARRFQQPLSLAVLEIASLQPDSTADFSSVALEVARLIRQKLHEEDILTHWEGNRWVAGLYGLTRSEGVEWVAGILETVRDTSFTTARGTRWEITLNAGVAEYPADGSTLPALYQAAAPLLAQAAPHHGHVLPVGWQVPAPESRRTDVLLVHSDATAAKPIIAALATRGYHYRWVQSGKAALEAVASPAPELQATVVIWADALPDMEVLPFLKQWKKYKLARTSRLILLLSSATGPIEPLLKLATFDYVTVPCNPNILMQCLYQARKISPI